METRLVLCYFFLMFPFMAFCVKHVCFFTVTCVVDNQISFHIKHHSLLVACYRIPIVP